MQVGDSLGRYELVEELGEGGMATVYLARDTELRRDVAIKVLFPHLSRRKDVVGRFQREARAAAKLDHPHILRVLDIGSGDSPGETPDPPYIVLELVRGPSLKEWIDQRGAPMAELVACLGIVICRALAVAHEAGIVHRDIKPANIMVADGGRVVLADFGVARVADEDSVVTKTGALLGTPSYMSPEQASAGDLDARSDLYSLGVTLYQLATGSLPFSGPTARVVGMIMAGDFIPPIRRKPVIGPDLSSTIMKLMSLDPDDRFPDAQTVAKRLETIAHDGGVEDVEDALTEYFDNPTDSSHSLRQAVIASTLRSAQLAGQEGNLPRAMALADRVLALDDGNHAAIDLVEKLGRHGRFKSVAIVGTLFALVAGAAAAVVLWPDDSVDSSQVDETLAATATTIDASMPMASDAQLGLDLDAGVHTATVADAAVTAPADARPKRIDNRVRPTRDATVSTARADGGAVAVSVRPDAALAPLKKASFSLKVDAWCELSVDGAQLGRLSAKRRYQVDPGKRSLRCEQATGRVWTRTVTFAPGEHRSLTGTILERYTIRVSVKKGDRVRIGGREYKNGARLTLKHGKRSVELLSGSRLITKKLVGFFAHCTIKDSPRLGCY